MFSKFMLDPTANSIAVLVLLGMIASIIAAAVYYIRGSAPRGRWPSWIIPVLAIIGLGVAIYLTYVESAKVEAVCGPVGDCNSVQQSPYATLFGFLPVGLLGALGYLAILVLWLVQHFGGQPSSKMISLAIWGLAAFGVLFSIYLTFLEPFVIGATCIWCITSAIVITLLFWATAGPALASLQSE
jgi:uncharacterized membrane protein